MQLVFAVAEELFTFAYQALFGRRREYGEGQEQEPSPKAVIHLSGVSRQGILPAPQRDESTPAFPEQLDEEKSRGDDEKEVRKENVPQWTTERVEQPGHANAASSADIFPRKNTVMYSASVEVPLQREPRSGEEARIAMLPYGTMVMVLDTDNGWSKVIAGEREGWVLTDDLADRAAHVYPQFSIGEANETDDPNTIRLRAVIQDAFAASASGMPLQSEEYVLYRIYRRGVRLPLPHIFSYEPRRWSSLLRELPGIALSPDPKAGAVMQVHFKEQASLEHFAYVEAVFPDGSIQVSEANWPEDGIYNERVLVKEEWHKLNPVFFVLT